MNTVEYAREIQIAVRRHLDGCQIKERRESIRIIQNANKFILTLKLLGMKRKKIRVIESFWKRIIEKREAKRLFKIEMESHRKQKCQITLANHQTNVKLSKESIFNTRRRNFTFVRNVSTFTSPSDSKEQITSPLDVLRKSKVNSNVYGPIATLKTKRQLFPDDSHLIGPFHETRFMKEDKFVEKVYSEEELIVKHHHFIHIFRFWNPNGLKMQDYQKS
jgi:hypothetical protein